MLEGTKVNLRVVEKEELKLFADFLNDTEVGSEYMPVLQQSWAKIKESYDKLPQEEKWFFIETKDGSRIGWVSHSLISGCMAIEYALKPSARNKGYCTEAVMIMVDYLFLSRDIPRIQAETLTKNLASQKVLEKTGFTKEAVKRQSSFVRGVWQDDILYSILRREWRKPKILTRKSDRRRHRA